MARLAAMLLLAAGAGASPVRVASLGGESRLLLDSTNLLHYPALVTELPHIDVELFDGWAVAAVPVGRHAFGLGVNRPDDGTDRLSRYVAGTGSDLLRSLEPRPWLDAVYGVRLGHGLDVAAGLVYAYDLRERGADRAEASRLEARGGLSLGGGERRLDLTVAAERVDLSDDGGGLRREASDGDGYRADLRGRLRLSDRALLLPSLAVGRSAYGLAPERGAWTWAQAAVGVNIRPRATVLGVAGLLVSTERQELDVPGDGLPQAETSTRLLPAVVAGGEVQVGAMLLRLGLRHESTLRTTTGEDGRERSFDGVLHTNVGLGFEAGPLAVDGSLEKDLLRDGPHFIGGSPRGGGLLTTLSLVYRLYR